MNNSNVIEMLEVFDPSKPLEIYLVIKITE
jgi:hypothetical protein